MRTKPWKALLALLAVFTLLGPDTVDLAPGDDDAPEMAAPGAATTREEATR